MVREVTLGIRSRNDLQEAARMNGTSLTVADCRPMERDRMVMMLDIQGAQGNVEATLDQIRSIPGVRQTYERIHGEGHVHLVAIVDRPGVCRAASGAAIICLDCPFNSTEVPAKWRFVVEKGDDISKMMSRLGLEGIEGDVSAVGSFEGREGSHTDQRVLRAAVENGYFDFPRRISLEGLSEIVGLPPKDLAKILSD